jgi:protein TonB
MRQPEAAELEAARTANERFKRRFGATLWGSVCGAVAVHAVVIALFPSMTVADVTYGEGALRTIELPDEIEIPEEPAEIPKPATPVASDVDMEFTIPSTTLATNPADRPLPPPPLLRDGDSELSEVPQWVPMTVVPELENRAEVERELGRQYPRLLRESGVGGAPLVWFFIDEEGRVVKTLLRESSGYDALDQAALSVGRVMRFRPALNRDRKVAVWVSLPIRFESKWL